MYSKNFSFKVNIGELPNPEECDATDDDSSNVARNNK